MLASGTRLGSYEILTAIGAGGWGEVYKALPIWSPDGTRIVFGSQRNGQWGFAQWRPDGTDLFYMQTNSFGKLMAVPADPAKPTFEYGDPVELFDSGYVNYTHGLNYTTYAVSPDGQRFLIPRPESAMGAKATPAPITVVVSRIRALTR